MSTLAVPESIATDDDLSALRAQARSVQRRRIFVRVAQVVVLLVALAAWEFLTGNPRTESFILMDSYYTSQPSEVWLALESWAEQGVLLSSILTTAQATVLGLAMGVALGMVVGFALAVSPLLGAVLNPFVSAVYSIPRLALIPLFLLWFGLGLTTRLALVTVMVFFLVFYNTFSGVRDVDRQLVDVLKLMGASRWQVYRKVVLQSAMIWIIAGLRIATPYALVGAVTAEMLASNEGLGFLVMKSSGQFYTAGVFAAIVVMMVMAMVLTGLVTMFEKRVLHWKPKVEERGGF